MTNYYSETSYGANAEADANQRATKNRAKVEADRANRMSQIKGTPEYDARMKAEARAAKSAGAKAAKAAEATKAAEAANTAKTAETASKASALSKAKAWLPTASTNVARAIGGIGGVTQGLEGSIGIADSLNSGAPIKGGDMIRTGVGVASAIPGVAAPARALATGMTIADAIPAKAYEWGMEKLGLMPKPSVTVNTDALGGRTVQQVLDQHKEPSTQQPAAAAATRPIAAEAPAPGSVPGTGFITNNQTGKTTNIGMDKPTSAPVVQQQPQQQPDMSPPVMPSMAMTPAAPKNVAPTMPVLQNGKGIMGSMVNFADQVSNTGNQIAANNTANKTFTQGIAGAHQDNENALTNYKGQALRDAQFNANKDNERADRAQKLAEATAVSGAAEKARLATAAAAGDLTTGIHSDKNNKLYTVEDAASGQALQNSVREALHLDRQPTAAEVQQHGPGIIANRNLGLSGSFNPAGGQTYRQGFFGGMFDPNSERGDEMFRTSSGDTYSMDRLSGRNEGVRRGIIEGINPQQPKKFAEGNVGAQQPKIAPGSFGSGPGLPNSKLQETITTRGKAIDAEINGVQRPAVVDPAAVAAEQAALQKRLNQEKYIQGLANKQAPVTTAQAAPIYKDSRGNPYTGGSANEADIRAWAAQGMPYAAYKGRETTGPDGTVNVAKIFSDAAAARNQQPQQQAQPGVVPATQQQQPVAPVKPVRMENGNVGSLRRAREQLGMRDVRGGQVADPFSRQKKDGQLAYVDQRETIFPKDSSIAVEKLLNSMGTDTASFIEQTNGGKKPAHGLRAAR